MELNKKILKLGLIFVSSILILSLGFAWYVKLDNPVFLKSYIEESISLNEEYSQGTYLELMYISNIDDDRRPIQVEFLENRDIVSTLNVATYDTKIENYGLYNINKFYVEIDRNSILKDFHRVELNSAKMIFDNGETMDSNLGRVILDNEDYKEKPFDFLSGSSSSDGGSSTSFSLTENINLIKLESALFENAKGLYEIKIGDKDYKEILGTSYKKGDKIKVNSVFKTPKDILTRYTQFDLKPRLYFKDSKGKQDYTRVYNINYNPYYFKFGDILKYLRVRGEI